VLVNQQASGSQWNLLLTTNFSAGMTGSVTVRNDGTTNYVVADGVRLLAVGSAVPPPPPPTVEVVALDPDAVDFGTNTARLAIVRSNDTNLFALTVNHTTGGSAASGVDYAPWPTSVTLAAGAVATNLTLVPIANSSVDGERTVTLTLQPSASYQLTALSNATVAIHDRPLDAWRGAQFTTNELADPAISGDAADPDGDRLANLMEYALGLPPKDPTAVNRPLGSITNGYFILTYTRAKAATDVSLVVEQSNDLVNWHSEAGYVQQISAVDEGAIQRITVQLTTPVAGAPLSYLRLLVTRL